MRVVNVDDLPVRANPLPHHRFVSSGVDLTPAQLSLNLVLAREQREI
jgi:hypothetical protein